MPMTNIITHLPGYLGRLYVRARGVSGRLQGSSSAKGADIDEVHTDLCPDLAPFPAGSGP